MKKTIAALALTVIFAAPAFAEEATDLQQAADQAAVEQTQTQEQVPQMETYSTGKVGRIIGRIIGGIARGDRRDGRWGRDRGDRWGRDRRGRGGYPQQQVVCYAQNRRGQTFQAVDYDANRAQQRAMNQCYAYSRFCAESGCRYY